MEEISMLVYDLDGTLLRSNGSLSDHTKKVLSYSIDSGIHVVIASGRPLCAIPEEVLSIRGIRYAITSNGSSVFTIPELNRVYGMEIDPDLTLSLSDMIREEQHAYMLRGTGSHLISCEAVICGTAYIENDYYNDPLIYGVPERVKAYVNRTRIPVPDIHDFIRMHKNEIESINIIAPDPSINTDLREKICSMNVYITSSTGYYIEIAASSVSKAHALDSLAVKLGISREQIAAFGDSTNDIELLSYAGYSVAMGNASDNVKKAAHAITLSNDEDGAAVYTEKLLHLISDI